METIIIQAESKKAKALKQFLKAFGIDFKVEQTTEESPDCGNLRSVHAHNNFQNISSTKVSN